MSDRRAHFRTGSVFTQVRFDVYAISNAAVPQRCVMRNLGWHAGLGGYVSEFECDGRLAWNLFVSPFEAPAFCPTPDLRQVSDMNSLEQKFGLGVDGMAAEELPALPSKSVRRRGRKYVV